MDYLNRLFARFESEDGQTMAEYALILVLVAVAAIAAFKLLGTNINAKVSNIASHIGP